MFRIIRDIAVTGTDPRHSQGSSSPRKLENVLEVKLLSRWRGLAVRAHYLYQHTTASSYQTVASCSQLSFELLALRVNILNFLQSLESHPFALFLSIRLSYRNHPSKTHCTN
jgi:hypothetical protein